MRFEPAAGQGNAGSPSGGFAMVHAGDSDDYVAYTADFSYGSEEQPDPYAWTTRNDALDRGTNGMNVVGDSLSIAWHFPDDWKGTLYLDNIELH